MKQMIFFIVIICTLVFDVWFANGLPWVTITFFACYLGYKMTAPFLRI